MPNKLAKIILLVTFCIVANSYAPKQWYNNLNCNMSEKQIIDNTIRILLEEGYNIGSADNNFVTAHISQPFIPVILNYKVRWNISAQSNKIYANAYVTNFWGLLKPDPNDEVTNLTGG